VGNGYSWAFQAAAIAVALNILPIRRLVRDYPRHDTWYLHMVMGEQRYIQFMGELKRSMGDRVNKNGITPKTNEIWKHQYCQTRGPQ
jgi:hypothetical protein